MFREATSNLDLGLPVCLGYSKRKFDDKLISMKNAILQKKQIHVFQDLVIPNPSEVHSYLKQHPEIPSILPALAKAARDEFQEPAELSLEVYHDPEIDDHYLTLLFRLPVYDSNTIKIFTPAWEKFETKTSK